MDKNLKSIAYAFVSKDLDIYIPDGEDDCIVVSKPVCLKCGQFWHTSYLECYFCGELNYYLYSCTICDRKYRITNSTVRCICGHPNSRLIKACVNEQCISNTDEKIRELTIKKGGVFNLSSSFNTSLNYCVSCGNTSNSYKFYRVYVYNINENDSGYFQEYIKKKKDLLSDDDLFIVKKK